MGEDIFTEQLEIKNGRLSSHCASGGIVGDAESLQMEPRMAPIYSVQTSRSILRMSWYWKTMERSPACFHKGSKAF